jgi:hypothetical protein
MTGPSNVVPPADDCAEAFEKAPPEGQGGTARPSSARPPIPKPAAILTLTGCFGEIPLREMVDSLPLGASLVVELPVAGLAVGGIERARLATPR